MEVNEIFFQEDLYSISMMSDPFKYMINIQLH